MEDVIRVIAITLETLLEDEENQIRHAMDWFPSFHVLLFRGLSCIVDASNLSLAHMTFWSPIEVQSLKSWSQRHHWLQLRRVINLCEKSIPMRHKGVNYIHLPSFVNTMFNFVKAILSKKIQNRWFFCCCPKYTRSLQEWNQSKHPNIQDLHSQDFGRVGRESWRSWNSSARIWRHHSNFHDGSVGIWNNSS